MRRTKWSTGLLAFAVAGAVALAAGCGDSTGPAGTSSVSLSVATVGSTPAASGSASPTLDISQSVGDNTLVLQDVSLVVDKLELQSTEGACAAESESESGGEAGGEESDAEHEQDMGDGCAEVETGPLLVQLPLDDAVTHVAQVDLPAGTYTKLEMEIHPPRSENSADGDFLSAHPDLEGVSIRVTGTWNGEPFTFERGIEAEQEVALDPPLEVTDATTSSNVTLSFDVRSWFTAPDGSLIDPSTAAAGGANAELVAENIRASLQGFEDADHDGHEDHEDASGDTGG